MSAAPMLTIAPGGPTGDGPTVSLRELLAMVRAMALTVTVSISPDQPPVASAPADADEEEITWEDAAWQ